MGQMDDTMSQPKFIRLNVCDFSISCSPFHPIQIKFTKAPAAATAANAWGRKNETQKQSWTREQEQDARRRQSIRRRNVWPQKKINAKIQRSFRQFGKPKNCVTTFPKLTTLIIMVQFRSVRIQWATESNHGWVSSWERQWRNEKKIIFG